MKPKRHNTDAPVPKEGSTQFITVFTDASWHPDTKAYGAAFWVKCYAGTYESTLAGRCGSSSEAEAIGLAAALAYVLSLDVEDRIVVIQCDNRGELNKLDISPLIGAGAKYVKRKHVYGHSGSSTNRSKVNNWVDRKAREARIAYEATL